MYQIIVLFTNEAIIAMVTKTYTVLASLLKWKKSLVIKITRTKKHNAIIYLNIHYLNK